METLYKLADGKAEAMEFVVNEEAKCTGVPLREMKLIPNVLIAAIIRKGKSLVADGNTEIRVNDHVILVAEAGKIKTINDIMKGAT